MENVKNSIANTLNQYCTDNLIIDKPTNENVDADLYTNVAFINAKNMRKSPMDVAEILSDIILSNEYVARVEIAKPGFINIYLVKSYWIQSLKDILNTKHALPKLQPINTKIHIEYVSSNPTGLMTIGHARHAVFGSTLVSALKLIGCDVISEYYVNDCGKQISALGKSIKLYNAGDISSQRQYSGQYIQHIASIINIGAVDDDADDSADDYTVGHIAAMLILSDIKNELLLIGVHHDLYTYESEIDAESILKNLSSYVYRGRIPIPRNASHDMSYDNYNQELDLFRSKDFGDDEDRAVRDADNKITYFGNDIAYHAHKINSHNPDVMINILGRDHIGYQSRLSAAVKAVNSDIDFRIIFLNLVNIIQDGKVVRMSKRAGNFISLREAHEACGKDPIRFSMLMNGATADINFDPLTLSANNLDNPCFYVQYAHARCKSILRKAQQIFIDLNIKDIANSDLLEQYVDKYDIELIKIMIYWPCVLNSVYRSYDPTAIARYATDMSRLLHRIWNEGHRFIDNSNKQLTEARCSVIYAFSIVMKSVLNVMGIDAPEQL